MITPAIDARPAQRYHQAAQGEIFGTTRSRLWRDGHFLKGSAVGFGSLATGLGMEGANAGLAAKPEVPAMDAKPDQIRAAGSRGQYWIPSRTVLWKK